MWGPSLKRNGLMLVAKGKSISSLIYAAFKDDVAFSIRDMKAFIKKGGVLSSEEINATLDKLFINLAYELEEEGIDNPETILDRAEAYLDNAQLKFESIPLYADVIEGASTVDGEIDFESDTITLDGEEYPIVSGSEYFVLKRSGKERRGRTITSFAELAEYVSGVPYVYAIEIVYNVSGTIVGYRVWVGKDV